MSDLFRSPDAIVVLNDDETYTNMSGCHVYLLHGGLCANDYDISTFAQDVSDHPNVQTLSIERLVEFYLAFEAMNAHAFNVNMVTPLCDPTERSPTDIGGMPEIDDDFDGVW